MVGDASAGASRALWPLPFAAALLPLLAVAIAYPLSIELGLAPRCNPFIDGCVSISRAGRQGLPNILFRALVLPAATLQIGCWLLCPAWLRSRQATSQHRIVAWLGSVAGAFLILYGTFLGTDGEGYRALRRYGVALYFGLTCIGMLLVSGEMYSLARAERLSRLVSRALVALCCTLPLLGLAHVLVPLALDQPATRDALENVTEWWGGAIFTAFFFALAWAWRKTGFVARLESLPPR
jgi:hypothetical protein